MSINNNRKALLYKREMDEDALYLATTSLLAEHLGFSAIECVDDIINAINDIMYASTEQLERVLCQSSDAALAAQGTARLESFMEHIINRNFDRFELYAFRNVFAIPAELVQNGCFLLDHHKQLELREDIDEAEARAREEQQQLLHELATEMARQKQLQTGIETLQRVQTECHSLRESLAELPLKQQLADQLVYAGNATHARLEYTKATQ